MMNLFEYAEAQRLATEGIELAAEHNASNVVKAREMAVAIADRCGTVIRRIREELKVK
jgi:hypothetical protein